ncbi:unnamed protein product [Paramecium sonneborni]|uniref:MORN repeat protein n=1 Tax=Paramecium sonneborni TaxID=65129 RepID=A0A8S1QK29_9CILI|nr:unnamed protein product [Paramecium sonneborni]
MIGAINSVRNFLKNSLKSDGLQERNNQFITMDGMESYCIINQWLFKGAKFSAKTKEDGTIIYLQDGCILYQDINNTLQNTRNLEQVKHLRWHGSYVYQRKVGKWYASWKGQILKVGGFYNDEGLKTGEWIEFFENFWDKSQVTYVGEYKKGIKQGKWSTYQFAQKQKQLTFIGEGYFDQFGIKQGFWFDLDRNFYDGRQLIYRGEYQYGLKQGRWDIYFQSFFDNRFKIIGGGKYDRNGNKNGKWVEEGENFWNGFQILEKGEYRNGIKIGLWESFQKGYQDDKYKLFGLGCYDKLSRKNGKWIEYHEKFSRYTFTLNYSFVLLSMLNNLHWKLPRGFKNWNMGNYKL